MLQDTWVPRDLPVLEALVELRDAEPFALVSLRGVAERTGLAIRDVGVAAVALGEAGYIDLAVTMTGGDPGPWFVRAVSAEARQATGAWPTPELMAQRIMEALEQASDTERDPATKQWLHRLLTGAGEVSKATTIEVLSSVLAKVVGGV